MIIPLSCILTWDTNDKVLTAACSDPIKWDLLYDRLAAANECRWATSIRVPWEHSLISDTRSTQPRYRGRFVKYVYIKMPRTPHSYFGQILLFRWLYKCHIARRRTRLVDCKDCLNPFAEWLFSFLGALAGVCVDLVHPNDADDA